MEICHILPESAYRSPCRSRKTCVRFCPVPTMPAVFAVQIKSGKTGKAEIKITGADISLIGMPVDCERQCHCMLCHSVRGVRRDTEYPDFSRNVLRICYICRIPHTARAITLTPNACNSRTTASFSVSLTNTHAPSNPLCQRNSIFVHFLSQNASISSPVPAVYAFRNPDGHAAWHRKRQFSCLHLTRSNFL